MPQNCGARLYLADAVLRAVTPPPGARVRHENRVAETALRCSGGIGRRKLLLLVQFLWSDFSWRRSLQFVALSAPRQGRPTRPVVQPTDFCFQAIPGPQILVVSDSCLTRPISVNILTHVNKTTPESGLNHAPEETGESRSCNP